MAQIIPQTPGVTGAAVTYAAATAGGDTLAVGSNVYLLVKNGGASAVTVTIATPNNSFNGQPLAATTASVAAAAEYIIPVKNDAYKNASGNASVTYSTATSVTVAALAV